jgi:hypothetical protein
LQRDVNRQLQTQIYKVVPLLAQLYKFG